MPKAKTPAKATTKAKAAGAKKLAQRRKTVKDLAPTKSAKVKGGVYKINSRARLIGLEIVAAKP